MSAISEAQAQLKKLGYYSGDVTGTMDAATKSALTQYQRDVGLTPSGELSDDALMSLSTDTAKKADMRVQVPQLKLVKREAIPDFYNRDLKALPKPRGGQDNARVPPEAGRIPSGPRVPQYAAQGMVPPSLQARLPATWLSAPPETSEGFTATHALLIVGGALAFGWWVGSRKGRGSPIIENGELMGADDGDEAEVEEGPKRPKRRRKRKSQPEEVESAEE